MSHAASARRWFVAGDLNGFFGLFFDNLAVLSYLSSILIFVFKFPADIVFGRMFPGTAIGVLLGDLLYTWMGITLARRTGRPVTAMPLGLDTPSTIGLALVVLGPAYQSLRGAGLSEHDAGMQAWYIGIASMIYMGIIKLAFAFLGNWVQRMVPKAGLLGSLAGIGLGLIGMTALLDIFAMPLPGVVALGLLLYTLVAGIRLPWGLPGVFASVALGTILYYALGPVGLAGGTYTPPSALHLSVAFPLPTAACLAGFGPALKFLPLTIPFALLTVIGGINTTESARVAGDDYRTRDILLVEAFATLAAGALGGVAQTTPYIGQPAYKNMGARSGYTLLTGILVGLGGMLGLVGFVVELLPRAVLAPILVFVGLDIVVQSFRAVPKKHTPAVALALFPTLARLLAIKMGTPEALSGLQNAGGKTIPELRVIIAAGNGFILTAMLWAGFLVEMIERRLRISAVYLAILAGFTLVGIIHSVLPDGSMYLPWNLGEQERRVPYQFALAYAALAVMLLGLSLHKGSRESGIGMVHEEVDEEEPVTSNAAD